MADAFTTNLGLNKQEVGQHNNTWGTVLNSDLDLIDNQFGAQAIISLAGGSFTLTTSEQNSNYIKITGVLASAQTVVFNSTGGTWVFENATTGGQDLTVKITGQTGVTVAPGERTTVCYNGTDIVKINTKTASAPIALTDQATVAVDLALVQDGGIFTLSAGGDRTLGAVTNGVDGKKFIVEHTASGGDRTLSLLAGSYSVGTDITAVTKTTIGTTDLLGFIYNATLGKPVFAGYIKGFL